MSRTTYVYDRVQEKVVPIQERVDTPQHARRSVGVMSDIQPFVTQEGIEITSRSSLRRYEQERGIRQCGDDWTGSSKPKWWDAVQERRRAR